MATVYIVTTGNWLNYRICAVCSSREAALAYIEQVKGAERPTGEYEIVVSETE